MYDVLVALQNRTLPFFEILIFWPSRGVQSSNIGQIWQKKWPKMNFGPRVRSEKSKFKEIEK